MKNQRTNTARAIPLAILFTDIVGSTKFFANKGDHAGLAMLERHNRALFPLVSQANGRVVKTIGDSIFAVFPRPDDALCAAFSMQRALSEMRAQPGDEDFPKVRIGVHYGLVTEVGKDVFGDAINLGERVKSAANADQILASRTLREMLRGNPQFVLQSVGAKELKGSAEPMELFELTDAPLLASVSGWQAWSRKPQRALAAHIWKLVAAVAVLLVVFAFWSRANHPGTAVPHSSATLTQRDAIILTDFDNKTGDPVFDATLKQALAMQLEQSPVLNVVSDQDLRQSLQFMGKSGDEKLTLPIAREISQREGYKALLTGSIAPVGAHYVIELAAVNTSDGDTFAREQAEANNKEDVLTALDKAATAMRARLGESMASIQKLDTPLGQATTSSLQAFQAYALGEQAHSRGDDFPKAESYYLHAVEIDPNFAMAYARLGVIYFGIGALDKAAQASTKAFELSKNVSERERLYISSRYYSDVEGDLTKALEQLNLYLQLYPADGVAANNITATYLPMGQYQQALTFADKTIALDPDRASGYLNLMDVYLGLDRPQDVLNLYQKNQARLQTFNTNLNQMLMLAAFLVGDSSQIEKQLQAEIGKPDEYQLVLATGWLYQADGRMKMAAEATRRAFELAMQQKLPEVAGPVLAYAVQDKALVADCATAKAEAKRALDLDKERITTFHAAEGLALCGDPPGAVTLANAMAKRWPHDSLVANVYVPVALATAALQRGDGGAALQLLQGHEAYDLVSLAPYIRGLAHLKLQQPALAEPDFKEIRNHRGTFVGGAAITQNASTTLAYPLAQLGLARAYAMAKDTAAAGTAYKQFLAEWKNADPDLAPLVEAKREGAALQ